MKYLLLILAGAALVLVLGALGLGYDLLADDGRVVYALLGRGDIVAACTPVLSSRLREAGFEPRDIEVGERPDIVVASALGRTLRDTFTFQDGAAGARVDGVVACVVSRGGGVSLEFRTSGPPVRAT